LILSDDDATLPSKRAMRFLTRDECKEWCGQRHFERLPYERGDSGSGRPPAYRFKIPTDAGQRVALCRLVWQQIVESEGIPRLLVIEGWSVWPSGEHFPLFTRLRDACGEHRMLIDVPGHLFGTGDDDDGLSFLVLATLFLWDYSLYSESGALIVVSHDEFGDVFEPKRYRMSGLRRGLELLQVLLE
jgi:hypothetical protein